MKKRIKKLNDSELLERISEILLKIDSEIEMKKNNILSLPTKEERIERVKEITKTILNYE